MPISASHNLDAQDSLTNGLGTVVFVQLTLLLAVSAGICCGCSAEEVDTPDELASSVESTAVTASTETTNINSAAAEISAADISAADTARPDEAVAAVQQGSSVESPTPLGSVKLHDWPGWRGPQGTGISEETGLVHEFQDGGPKVLWKVALGTGFSGVAVAQGAAVTLYGRDGRERVVCLDARTGDRRWEIDCDEDFAQGRSFGPRAMPWIDGDRVYTVGASGRVLCLDLSNGTTQWELNLVKDLGMRLHEEGQSPSPLIDGDHLILLASTPGACVLCLDKLTGQIVWKSLDDRMNHSSPALVEIDGTRQLLVLTGNHLAGISRADGRELWRAAQQGVNIATPVLGPGNTIFTAAAYGYGSQLTAIEGGTARQVWKNSVLASHHATPILHGGLLYGFHDRVGVLKCVDMATGEERWVTRESGKGKMILADDQLIIINEEGTLLLAPVSADGFRPTARARVLKGTCFTAPSLASGLLYVRSDAELICIDMRAGD